MATVRKAAKDLMEKSDEDSSHLQTQIIDLTTKWERACKLSSNKQDRLDEALKEADDFHKKTHSLLDWLAEAERTLRYQGTLPDDEDALVAQQEDHCVRQLLLSS